MATINGVTFNMRNLRPVAVHRNSVSEQPGSDTNFITDMGYGGLVLRLEGYEESLATYDSVISEFMKSGEQTLVHRTGWQFKVYSVQLTPELIEGIVDNYFPYDLILYTSTPYRESTTLDCRVTEITTNNQEWSAGSYPCPNFLSNWSFEDWSNGTSSAPDEWINSGLAQILRDTKHKYGSYSAKLAPNNTTDYLYHNLDDPTSYRNKTLTFGCWCWTDTSNQMRLFIEDGVSISQSAYHSGNSTWELLTVTRTIDAAATLVYCMVYPSATNGFTLGYTDGAVIIEGDSIPDNTYDFDIDTDGVVDAVPDIKITGDTGTATSPLAVEPISEPGFETITNWTYSEVDTSGNIFGGQNSTYEYEGTYCYEVNISTGALINEYGQITQTGVNFDTIGYFTFMQRFIKTSAFGDVCRLKMTIGGVQYGSWDCTTSGDSDSGWVERVVDVSDVVGTKDVVFRSTLVTSGLTGVIFSLLDSIVSKKTSVTFDPVVYNTADTTVKCEFGTILDEAIHEVCVDGTGTIKYSDDFATGKYKYDALGILNVTHDTVDDELDIADDGYIYWLIDTKGPVTGIPTLTSQINITTGTPTIQISTDAATWYDITTAIVDDVDTVYELDSSSLHLKGKTLFYWRFDCVKAGAATCSVKSFELDINLVTIDFEHPVITSGGAASTFRCDQDAASSMNCTIALIYRDRSWPA